MITYLSAMAMLGGFNPETGTFEDLTPVIQIPRNTATRTYTASRRKRSIFNRFNDSIEDIGNWFADNSDSVLGWMSMIVIGLIVISGIIAVISTWIKDGFLMALLVAGIALVVCGIAVTVASVVIAIAVNVIMYAFRLIFWNGWTFLIALALGAGGIAYAALSSDSSAVSAVETVATQYDRYECIAKVLNVRQSPTKNSKVLGTLRKGDVVEVKELSNGFARIDFNGREGYASVQYLIKLN